MPECGYFDNTGLVMTSREGSGGRRRRGEERGGEGRGGHKSVSIPYGMGVCAFQRGPVDILRLTSTRTRETSFEPLWSEGMGTGINRG